MYICTYILLRKTYKMQRICPYTKQTFIPKRSNQKFLNSESRIAYHNAMAKKERRNKLPIFKVLKNNYNILISNLNSKSEVVRSKEFLRGAGFNFNQMTSFHQIEGTNTAVIFDLGYQKTEKGNYRILRCG